jgi:hypothetical protein
MAHPAGSPEGSFPAHSARTGSNSGTRAKARFSPFAESSANGRYWRQADIPGGDPQRPLRADSASRGLPLYGRNPSPSRRSADSRSPPL